MRLARTTIHENRSFQRSIAHASSPLSIINGQLVSGAQPLEHFVQLLAKALALQTSSARLLLDCQARDGVPSNPIQDHIGAVLVGPDWIIALDLEFRDRLARGIGGGCLLDYGTISLCDGEGHAGLGYRRVVGTHDRRAGYPLAPTDRIGRHGHCDTEVRDEHRRKK